MSSDLYSIAAGFMGYLTVLLAAIVAITDEAMLSAPAFASLVLAALYAFQADATRRNGR